MSLKWWKSCNAKECCNRTSLQQRTADAEEDDLPIIECTTAHARNRYICKLAYLIMMVDVIKGSSLYGLHVKFRNKLT